MDDRGSKRGLAIVVIIVGLGVAGIATWLFWWEPRQARAEATAQVTGWEARWLKARECVLGAEPLAADASDAIALAELQSGGMSSTAKGCTDLIGGITRAEGARASTAVEEAFREVEAAIPAVAKAYAFRVSAEDAEIDRRVVDLGVAISALDGAHDRLRAAAGLPPMERKAGPPIRRLAEPTPLVADGVPFTATSVNASGGVVRGEHYVGGIKERLFATGPDQVHRQHWAAEAIASVPGATWMVAALPGRAFDAGALDTAIAIAAMPVADTVDFAAASLVIPVGEALVPVAALGDGAEKTVVLVRAGDEGTFPVEDLPAFRLASSHDGGRTWVVGDGVVNGRVDTVIADPVTGNVWVSGDSEAPSITVIGPPDPVTARATPLLSPPPDLAGACRRGASLAWLAYDTVHRLENGTETQATITDAVQELRLADCTDRAVLVEEGSMPVRYRRYIAAECKEVFRGATYAYGRPAMRDDGTVLYAAGRGALIALWTEGVAAPTYFKLPRALTLDEIVVWNGAPYALVHDPKDASLALLTVKLG
jgi:hypothetical protein